MIAKVYQYMESHHMIPPGQRILVAVSGGADSMCLLQVLLELQKQLQEQAKLEIRVLHVHHGLRESAEGDLQYVSQYCEAAGVPFQAVRVDAGQYATENGMSVEEAARHLRYEALEKAAREWDEENNPASSAKARDTELSLASSARDSDSETQEHSASSNPHLPCRIAVAHHMEDQAETVLFHLVRGSRLTGLRGMLPVNGRIIRPLLNCGREEIEDFLKQRGISWREDETNEDVRYARNLLRKQVIPQLLTINEVAMEHIARAAEEVAEAESYLAGETMRALRRCCLQEQVEVHADEHVGKSLGSDASCLSGSQEYSRFPDSPSSTEFDFKRSLPPQISLHIPTLMAEPPLLQRRVVYAAIAEAAGRKKDLHDIHVQDVLKLCRKQGNGQLDVAGGVHVRKVYEDLYLEPGAGARRPIGGESNVDGTPPTPQDSYPTGPEAYVCRVFDFDGDMGAVPRNLYTKWLDYDKIMELPSFRTRRGGDRITLDASGKSKSIARYMIDQKVPAQLRDRIVMPACGNEILWVPGGRISAAYMVSSDTKRILEIQWKSAKKQMQ